MVDFKMPNFPLQIPSYMLIHTTTLYMYCVIVLPIDEALLGLTALCVGLGEDGGCIVKGGLTFSSSSSP